MLRSLLLVFVSLILLSCKTTSFKVGNFDIGKVVNQGLEVWDANNIDTEQEIQLGQNISAVLLGVRPLYGNEQINAYVNSVGQWLALNSPRPELPWQFGVIDSESINAFAAPGGYVFITSAMLAQLNSEAELAAVLAHEISHVTQMHHLNAIKSGTLQSAVTETLFVSAEAYQANTNADKKQREYALWAKTISQAAQELYSKGLAREDEIAADRGGIRLLARAGYDVYGYISSIQAIEAIAPDDSSLALLYQTHPTPTERLSALESDMESLSNTQGQVLTDRFIQVLSGQKVAIR